MARKRRIDFPGAWHLVMNRGARRESIFRDEADCLLFLDCLAETVERFSLQVHAYALMPNHYTVVVSHNSLGYSGSDEIKSLLSMGIANMERGNWLVRWPAGAASVVAVAVLLSACSAALQLGAKERGIEWVWSDPAGLYVAKTETTLGQYQACEQAGACESAHYMTKSVDLYCNWGYEDRDNHPMNCVSWSGAAVFCQWAGGRLPTEDEWYAEASNGGSRQYPWGGQSVTCDLAVWSDSADILGCGQDSTWPVCSRRSGNSASGLCDMVGNVWEWTSSWYESQRANRVLRGGAWFNHDPEYLRTSYRTGVDPDFGSSDFVGFRCVRPAQ